MLHFAAINCHGIEDQQTSAAESDIFEMIQMYPGALDVYGMNIGYNGKDYDSAVYFFSQEMPEIALDHLRNAINFNGITAESLNLSAASYRLVGEYKKALPFLILAYYLDRSSPYIAGNICLVLNQLNYPKLGILIDSFIDGAILDPWSKNEIENLKSTLQ
jgi:tetratricopeptide (TPR) repeat protein